MLVSFNEATANGPSSKVVLEDDRVDVWLRRDRQKRCSILNFWKGLTLSWPNCVMVTAVDLNPFAGADFARFVAQALNGRRH